MLRKYCAVPTPEPIRRGAARTITRFGLDRSGVSAIEFALILPVILLMFFGMVELSTAIMVQRHALHGNAAIGDLSSRYGNPTYVNGVAQGTAPINPAMTPSTMNDIFTAGDLIMAPYPILPLLTRVSSIVVDANGVARINWSCTPSTQSGTPSQGSSSPQNTPGPWTAVAPYSPPAGLLVSTSTTSTSNGVTTTTTALTPGDSLIMSEDFYPYTSYLQYFLKNALNFKSTYYFKPRGSVSDVGFFPGTSAKTWNGTWDSASTAASTTANGVTCSYQTG